MGSILVLVMLVVVGVSAGISAALMRGKLDFATRRLRNTLATTSAGALGLAALVVCYKCIVVIPPGSVGVPVFFGRVIDQPMADGLHFVPP